jgi:hypothetical protein
VVFVASSVLSGYLQFHEERSFQRVGQGHGLVGFIGGPGPFYFASVFVETVSRAVWWVRSPGSS